eukprot:jgi/Orpsp1_1/1178007/evm.model.c7180000063709.1
MKGKLKKIYKNFLYYGTNRITKIGCSLTRNCFRFPDRLERFILNRPKGVPLITYCNHLTVLDDPIIWGGLNNKYLKPESFRYTIGAKELCSGKGIINDFFNAARIITVIRGNGVYQKELDKAVDIVHNGEWLHIFPEGKIHPDNNSRINEFKWGVGRFIMECKKLPIVIPIYIYDLDNVFFVDKPFVNLREKYIVTYGNPIDIKPLFKGWEKIRNDAKELSKAYLNFKSKEDGNSYIRNIISENMDSLYNANNNDNNNSNNNKKQKQLISNNSNVNEKFTSTKHLWDRLSRSKDKSFTVVPTVFKPSNYLNPLKYNEDGNEHFMINGIQLIRSQFTNILREELISLRNETKDWILKQQTKQQLKQNLNDRLILNDEFYKKFRINTIYEN